MKIDLTKFEIPDIDSWKNQVLKETKDDSAFVYENELENIKIDTSNKNLDPGSYSTSNFQDEWDIVSSFKITESFKNNQALIQCLEHGSNHLYLEIYDKNPSWDKIFSNIRIEIIHVTIAFRSKGQIESFKSYLPQQLETFISISIDPFEMEYYELFKDSGVSFCIDGFSIEQIGASSNQQLAMVIYCGEYILQQCKNQHRIKFQLGIGSDFLIETSKIRAFKWIWQHVLDENNYQDNQIHIIGTIGWTNKSIKDPHMNLLRHTTEGLSALSGGVSGLLIHPANELSNLESNWFDMRMALNISHILKEESFISKVADPLNGSFIIEMLTKQIINNSWELFLELYDNKGDENKNLMLSKINLIRNIKIQRFLNGKKQLLGINLFKTKKEESNKWELIPKYLDMDYLIYENLHENEG